MKGTHPTAFIHPLAYIAGDVTIGPRVSVWPFASIRGDSDVVTIDEDTNVQDGCVIHVDQGVPCRIGKRVGIGHRAIVHGAVVENDVLIGMGAVLLNGVRVSSGSIIGAGSVVREGFVVPPNCLVLGVPGRIVRETTMQERDRIAKTVEAYIELQERYR
ncbi:MAG TPA: gamma carbonic anhydrase family protein [Gemmatimonadaceae bacterium]|nr:gamma carbonic anhydrase family protein [Gemmatimonadaceae bacterium]